jgi:soluble lytic murein transglycosylase
MSSMMSKLRQNLLVSTACLAATSLATACNAQPVPSAQATVSTSFANPADQQIAGALAQWSYLKDNENAPFASLASFLLNNPGWPGESAMRKTAERAIQPGVDSPSTINAYFGRYPAQTATAALRHAEALNAMGKQTEARDMARKAWALGSLSPDDEARFQSKFGSSVSTVDHDARMDKLLWSRATTIAARQLAWTSADKRPLFAARLAFLTKAVDAASRAAQLNVQDRNDPGYVADRAWWLRNTNQALAVRSHLAAERTLTKPPLHPDAWLEMLERNAEDAARDNQWRTVYDIARQIDGAYAPGTLVRERSLSERDSYTDIVFLGGTAAFSKLGMPAQAVPLFERYANAAKSGQTRSKGLYWAGRAAEAAGDQARAASYYEQAAQYFDHFHGQLATERLGRTLQNLTQQRVIPISASERASFNERGLVKAVSYLGRTGRWQDQSLFVRTLANSLKTDGDHFLATEFAARVNRPDLGVMVGRNARASGFSDYFDASFPKVPIPSEHASSWTIIHAISRQESQFDRQATSRVGARGLMQLMPGTARETAPRAGLSYNYGSLIDPQYNIALGSTYFSQLMSQFNGNYVLAVAAYNAGPGNVRKWLNANGDPRTGVDVMTWIEAIPLSETRNYVQRVLENAVVYDLITPGRPNVRSKTPLSTYLGKGRPG